MIIGIIACDYTVTCADKVAEGLLATLALRTVRIWRINTPAANSPIYIASIAQSRFIAPFKKASARQTIASAI